MAKISRCQTTCGEKGEEEEVVFAELRVQSKVDVQRDSENMCNENYAVK